MSRWDFPTHTFDWKTHLYIHINDLLERRRNFVWYSIDNEEDKKYLEKILRERDMKLIKGLPFWFVVAYHPDVPKKDVEKMKKLIKPSESKEVIIWKGKQFGYSDKQIKFYLKYIE